ncbi:MAG TPA: 16S rRNA (cytidine(1402)-2'-O)-methyltransferase [Vicinamibacteria bacterium]|nr:16S rRNA (cytidine(1402)-2'-O)-methyltransferase [Vicinamibacteria bacterium]
MSGILFVVSTPIGNLGDVSERALEVLRSVAVVACEDTRVTGKLLQRFGVATRVTSYHEHNEARRAAQLVERLRSGDDVALVSDAGTPLVSDPGYRLVRSARENGVPIRAVPGPSAAIAALAISGLPPTPFTFLGFIPPRGQARGRAIDSLRNVAHTIVLFEAPSRIGRLLSELATVLGDRQAVLLRELTKLHEEHWWGSLGELALKAKRQSLKGELTLVVSGGSSEQTIPLETLAPRFAELRHSGLTARDAARVLAREHGLSARAIYQAFAVSGSEQSEPP